MSVRVAPSSAQVGFVRPNDAFAPAPSPQPSSAYGFDLSSVDPLSGQSLDDFLQQLVVGVTGLDGTLVRPRWQPEPPNLPPIGTTWAAVGVTRTTPLGFPALSEIYNATLSSGYQRQSDQEEVEVLCSFYGPNADAYAILVRTGLMIAQNREVLQVLSMGLVNTSGRTRVPTLVQQRWMERVDVTVTLRREVRSYYPILYFLSAPVAVTTDTGVVDRTS